MNSICRLSLIYKGCGNPELAEGNQCQDEMRFHYEEFWSCLKSSLLLLFRRFQTNNSGLGIPPLQAHIV